MNELVSIIIPTYNRCADLDRCLSSIKASTYHNYEIIVVDNASTDGTKAMIATKYSDSVTYILKHENTMAAGGRNTGIAQAIGEYCLFIDSDNIIDSQMIEHLVAKMQEDASLGLIGPLMLYHENPQIIWCIKCPISYQTGKSTFVGRGVSLSAFKLDEIYYTNNIPNLFLTRTALAKEVRGFDRIYEILFEESDFAAKIAQLGYDICISTKAITQHNVPLQIKSTNSLRRYGIDTPKRAWLLARNRFIFVHRFARRQQRTLFLIAIAPAYAMFYALLSLLSKSPSTAVAYIKGTFAGYTYIHGSHE